jgi:hypothetical protein
MIISSLDELEALPSPALGLLPAVHDATALLMGLPDPTVPAVGAGQVFQNVSNGALSLPAYEAWPAHTLAHGDYAGSDGRFWYPVARYKETNTFHPIAFARTIYTIAFTPTSLPLRQVFKLERLYRFRLFANNTDVVWNVVWEFADRTSESDPAPTGPNIKGYTFREPLLDEQVPITDVVNQNTFGISLQKTDYTETGEPTYSAIVERFGRQLAATPEQLPLTENFILRLRLASFDTQDNVADPRGFVAYVIEPTKK